MCIITKVAKLTITSKKNIILRKVTRLRIVLSELPENVIQEVVAYTWNQYLADIGGATSLILGISAVTILTFVENCLMR